MLRFFWVRQQQLHFVLLISVALLLLFFSFDFPPLQQQSGGGGAVVEALLIFRNNNKSNGSNFPFNNNNKNNPSTWIPDVFRDGSELDFLKSLENFNNWNKENDKDERKSKKNAKDAAEAALQEQQPGQGRRGLSSSLSFWHRVRAVALVQVIRVVLALHMEGTVLRRLPPSILWDIIVQQCFLHQAGRPRLLRVVTCELDRRRQAYEFGDVSKYTWKQLSKTWKQRFGGNGGKDYQFGDITRMVLAKASERASVLQSSTAVKERFDKELQDFLQKNQHHHHHHPEKIAGVFKLVDEDGKNRKQQHQAVIIRNWNNFRRDTQRRFRVHVKKVTRQQQQQQQQQSTPSLSSSWTTRKKRTERQKE